MTHKTKCRANALRVGGTLLMVVASAASAQEKPYSQAGTALPVPPPPPPKSDVSAAAKETGPKAAPETNPVDQLLNGKIPDALAKGKLNMNVRLRYEYVDQSTFSDESYAPTVRTRLGYTTAPLYGFQAMAEGENVSVIGNERNYNAAGSNKTPYKPVVADPETTELNQAWMSYTYTNWATAKGGLQRIVLDNQRFIGDSGWRQNMQTFEAVSVEGTPLSDLTMFYAYVWDVHRVFGNVDGLPYNSPNRNFDSDSHLMNVSYTGWKYARFVGYSYLLDLHNNAGSANSCATYGGYVAGTAPVSEKVALGYRGEFAYQTEYANSPLNYGADYYNLELSATVKPVSFGGGLEVLGTDSNGSGTGSVGFKTPLATLHAFNGWDDVFLNTPPKGLRDLYGFSQITLPGDVPVRAVYHKYDAASGDGDFGQEIDLLVSKKFGKYWTVLAKYAYYDGKDAPARYDVQKLWAQVEFNF